jgi:hypothetical protein
MQNGMIVDLPLAPIAIMLFLGAVVALATGTIAAGIAAFNGNQRFASLTMKSLFVGVLVYAALLFGSSVMSQERVLAKDVEKHYCEIDCHIAYSVTEIHRIPTYKSRKDTLKAGGEFYIVNVKTHFDEKTIGKNRGNGPLEPGPHILTVFDARGNEYKPVAQSGTDMREALRPGESYTTTVIFDLPAKVERPKLYIRSGGWPDHFLIGHEESWLHKKAYFDIGWVTPTTM